MSEVKVNKVSPRTGTDVTLGDSGDTFTVPSGATLTTTSATVNLPATTTVTTELKTNKISPASGTAFTLGDSGDTFTIPSGATIANSGTATGFGGGKILATYQDTKTDIMTTTSSSHTDVTGLVSPSITPASSSSKFIINVSIGSIANSTGNARAFIRVVRRVSSSDTVVLQGDAATGDETMMAFCTRNNDGQHAQHVMGFTVIDSPSTTSDIIYAVQVSRGSDSGTVTINSAYTSTAERGNCASTIVVQEVSS